MSNSVSALDGKVVASDVTVSDCGLRGMIALRGDLSAKALTGVVATVTGAELPRIGKVTSNGENVVCWMSPDEVLILVPYGSVPQALQTIKEALAGSQHLAENVSDARALIKISGPFVRDVIAKLAPVDLHPDSLSVGDFRRSRLGQVAAAFWMTDASTAYVICFRSVAAYTFDLLAASAQAGPVEFFPSR